MSLTRLQDDLLSDFKEQKQTITQQIELIDPLATSLRRPVAQRLASKGGLILSEMFCYMMALGFLALTIAMNLIPPFRPLTNVRYVQGVDELSSLQENELFSITVHCMAAVIGLLFFVIGRMTRRIRLKNNVLDLAGKNMKLLVGQHLQRRAAIETIEQRHFLDLPAFSAAPDVNTVPNPGYEPAVVRS